MKGRDSDKANKRCAASVYQVNRACNHVSSVYLGTDAGSPTYALPHPNLISHLSHISRPLLVLRSDAPSLARSSPPSFPPYYIVRFSIQRVRSRMPRLHRHSPKRLRPYLKTLSGATSLKPEDDGQSSISLPFPIPSTHHPLSFPSPFPCHPSLPLPRPPPLHVLSIPLPSTHRLLSPSTPRSPPPLTLHYKTRRLFHPLPTFFPSPETCCA
ncbi:uncharacterized protein SCHCODRAFT_02644894 [Schizophyllum commune H4-8]|nr:uncharacterized protein SCHCODRAFT_02644894 [Schizophyllum commune H4-8]KAI5885035.1 hypothetical protein SCHCODRAFT_02644894 [Schizophyllum commune H4-8]